MIARARSAAASVWAKVLPGGSDTVTCDCDTSSAGMKPVGSSGASASEPTRKAPAASSVSTRWFRHQRVQRRHTVIQRESGPSAWRGARSK